MEWLTKHFAVVSAVLVFVAGTASVSFLFAYLSVFDWRLIWLIEYSDLAKLFLLFGALISSFAWLIMNIGQNYFPSQRVERRTMLISLGILGGLFLVSFGVDIYNDFHANNDLMLYHSNLTACWLVVMAVCFLIFEWRHLLLKGDWSAIWPIISLMVVLVPVAGSTYGRYVKEIAEPHVTIWSKREEFPNTRIIVWFSHHVAFYTGQKVIVLPTGDVAQMELTQARP
jgi:hypothetical protein